MGTKRIGLARVQALIENLKRELAMGSTTFTSLAVKKNVVVLDEATYAPTVAESGTIFVFDGTACTVTLPQATAGVEYTFTCNDTCHANSIITTLGPVGLAGALICTTAALNNTNLAAGFSIIDSWVTSIDTFTLNGSTQGGLLGTQVTFTAVSPTMWNVSGIKVGSGTLVTSAS